VANEDAVSIPTALSALVSADEWAIECGIVSCSSTIADVAWIDINFNMAMNSSEIWTDDLSVADLPAPQFRRYRLGVMFPSAWSFREESNHWFAEHRAAADALVPWSSRVVRGGWNPAELGQLGAPPFTVECPECKTLQAVGSHRRKGTPRPGAAIVSSPPPGEPGKSVGAAVPAVPRAKTRPAAGNLHLRYL
jgi:hypothetical protein